MAGVPSGRRTEDRDEDLFRSVMVDPEQMTACDTGGDGGGGAPAPAAEDLGLPESYAKETRDNAARRASLLEYTGK